MDSYIVKLKDGIFYVQDNKGFTIGEASTALEAAAQAAESVSQPGSYFWHKEIAGILAASSPEVLNASRNPFAWGC